MLPRQAFINKFLLRHRLRQHYEGKVFKCHCGALFPRKQYLTKHLNVHGPVWKTVERGEVFGYCSFWILIKSFYFIFK